MWGLLLLRNPPLMDLFYQAQVSEAQEAVWGVGAQEPKKKEEPIPAAKMKDSRGVHFPSRPLFVFSSFGCAESVCLE